MLKCHWLTVGVLALGASSLARGAALVNIDFQSGGDPTASGAAVLGQAGDVWNGIDGSAGGTIGPLALVDNLGAASPVTATFSCDGAVPAANPAGQPVPALTHDYIFNNSGGPIVATLAGLLPSQDYQLVLYVASDDASGGSRSVAGSVTGLAVPNFSATGDPQTTFIAGENIVNLNMVSDATGTLVISEADGLSNSDSEVDLDGLQVQAVPEPTSWILLGSAGAVLLARRRRIVPVG